MFVVLIACCQDEIHVGIKKQYENEVDGWLIQKHQTKDDDVGGANVDNDCFHSRYN